MAFAEKAWGIPVVLLYQFPARGIRKRSRARGRKSKMYTFVRRFFGIVALHLGVICFFTQHALATPITNLDDLNYWGSGANRSAILIDWNDGKSTTSLAWGYQWDTAPALADVLIALAGSDIGLFLRVDTQTPFGLGLFGIGQRNGPSAFGVSGAQDELGNPVTPVFTAGVDDMNTSAATFDPPLSSAGTAPVNAVDYYQEGWFDNGFWGLYFAGTDNFSTAPGYTYPTEWIDAWEGVGSTTLVNEGWYAFSFADNFVNSDPRTAIAAVPEPGVSLLVLLGGALLVGFRRLIR